LAAIRVVVETQWGVVRPQMISPRAFASCRSASSVVPMKAELTVFS
jgi:hypothetical protein